MDFFIYRNFTAENLFQGLNASFSAYGDISQMPSDARYYIWFYLPEIKMKQLDLLDEISGYRNKLDLLLHNIPDNKFLVVFTITTIFKVNYRNSDFRFQRELYGFNSYLYELAETRGNIKVIDIDDFLLSIGVSLIDWKFYYLSQSIISPRLNSKFKKWFQLKINAIENKRKKCLVLDLDNTLWGGILGEDGIEGIKLGDVYPGLAFTHFQQAILDASNSGVILAVCSKNNEEDVMEVLNNHPFQLIKLKHISSYRINWNDKASNIKEIADELNIGLESIVFIDDNPVERERVKQMLPDVNVPDFPSSPFLMASYFKEIYDDYFQTYNLTNEDLQKTNQYIANAERNSYKKSFTTVAEYLESLEMELEVYGASNYTIPRIAQMTQKTNQFNLTTRRYTEFEIKEKVLNGDLIYCLSVKDKFGDNGISLLSIIGIDNGIAVLDTFLLSCRILGRNIEMAFLNYIINELYEKGVFLLKASYIPTKKNKQTESFLDSMGFDLIYQNEDGYKEYAFKITEKKKIETYYKIKHLKDE